MDKWVSAVRSGASLAEVIPVKAAPTLEQADMLATRLSFLRDEILSTENEHSGNT
jgi:hypothetical protein